ncbi:hypothetical protein B0H14DRAFT_2589009 [Mycena olivaceomarginata]|nr:hypothetical protein B0H14DRAFT_2589009 [Mycena olivaceomarginata]
MKRSNDGTDKKNNKKCTKNVYSLQSFGHSLKVSNTGVFLTCLDHPLWDVPCFVFFAWDVPWVFWLGTYHPPQAEQKNLWDVPWSHFECWTPGTSGPRKAHFCRHFWVDWARAGLQLEDLNITASKKLGLRAAIPRSTVVLGLRAVFCAARLCSGCGRYSAQHGCARVAGGILHSTVVLGLRAVFRAARLCSGCGRYSVQHGCARVAGGIPCSTVALGLWAAIPRSTVVLRLRAVFRAARLCSGCGRYSAQHGCARVAGGIPCSTVVLGLWAAIPRSTVALGLRAVFRAARLRSGCGRYSAQHGCAQVAGGIPCSTVALGLWVAIPRSTVVLRLWAVFRAAQLRSGCGRSSVQHGCTPVTGKN